MKALALILAAVLVVSPARADDGGPCDGLTGGALAQCQARAQTKVITRALAVQAEKQEARNILTRWQGQTSKEYVENLSDPDLDSAVPTLQGEMDRLSVILADLHLPSDSAQTIFATSSERIAKEQACRHDPKCIGERKIVRNIVIPLCDAHWGLEIAEQTIKVERANPSGVVDLQVLHDAGDAVTTYRSQIAALNPLYTAARHHAFTRWQDEKACVVEAQARQAQQ